MVILGIASKERHNERATSRKSDKSKTVSKEPQEYCKFELNIVFLVTKSGLFCDGTRRYGVPAPFFQVKTKQLFAMYIVNE